MVLGEHEADRHGVEDTAAPSPSPKADSRGALETKRPLVLIVDDNEKNLKLARDVLEAAGLGTLEAATGAEGIALAAERRPDVVLLDLRLPDLDGVAVARVLRAGKRTAHIPVVALSALRSGDDREWFLAAGFAGYLEKPIDIGAFPDQVRSYCAST